MPLALPVAALAAALTVAGAAATQPTRPVTPPPTAPAPAVPAGPAVIYVMEQLITGPLPAEVMHELEPLHTIADIEALLKSKKIAFGWRQAEINSAQIAPEIQRLIPTLPPHEVFVTPQGQGVIMSVILDQHPAPPPQ